MREGGAGGPAASGPERAELSFAQQRLWFLDQWSPGNLAYVIPVALRLSGDLDTPALDVLRDEPPDPPAPVDATDRGDAG